MRCGDAVYMAVLGVPSEHLWILISDPAPDTFLGVMVSVTTLRHGHDQTVILQVGDHPFITRPSAVYFGDARLFDTRRIDQDILVGNVQQLQCCSPSLLSLLQRGVLASPRTPNKILEVCRNAFAKAQ